MYKSVAVTLFALSLAACGNNDVSKPLPTTPPVECGEGQVQDAGKGGCIAVEAPAVEADTVPVEGIAVTVDPVVAKETK